MDKDMDMNLDKVIDIYMDMISITSLVQKLYFD